MMEILRRWFAGVRWGEASAIVAGAFFIAFGAEVGQNKTIEAAARTGLAAALGALGLYLRSPKSLERWEQEAREAREGEKGEPS